MITWENVVTIAPELAVVPSATQAMILSHVALQLAPRAWGDRFDMGSTYLAAHLGALWKRSSEGGIAGPVSSESVGDVSRAYAIFSPTGSDALLDVTPYGKEYRRMQMQLPARLGIVL